MGLVVRKEMKYNLHYGEVRRDVLRPPHGTNTSCTLPLETKNTLQIENKTLLRDRGISKVSLLILFLFLTHTPILI